MPEYVAAKEADPVTHDGVSVSGVVGPPASPPPGPAPVLINGLPAAILTSTVICAGTTAAGPAHPPPPGPPPPVLSGCPTVQIHRRPAARWAPSGDIGGCGSDIGLASLASTRDVLIGGPPAPPRAKLLLAWSLISIRGHADSSDGALVVQELLRWPTPALQRLANQGTRVAVGRGSITDIYPELSGQHPRGYPAGATWNPVTGANMPDRNEVGIATVGHGTPEGAHVPNTGEGHGSRNLVLHETAHALDLNSGSTQFSNSPGFNGARNADSGTLSNYESQPGNAGQQETFAESAARYYGSDPSDAANHPNLHNYWAGNPLGPPP